MNINSHLKMHFESGKPEADQAYYQCVMQYGQADLEKADVHVVLGGDGSILTAMHNQIKKGINVPIFGLNFGHVGRMCNDSFLDNLPQRIQKAERQEIIPLKMTATFAQHGWKIDAYAFNEFSVLRYSPQMAHLKLTILEHDMQMNISLEGDGIILSTPIGSTGYYANVGGAAIQMNQKKLGLHSVNAKKTVDFLLSDDSKIAINKFQGQKRPIMIEGDGQRFSNISRAVLSSAFDKKKILLFDSLRQNSR